MEKVLKIISIFVLVVVVILLVIGLSNKSFFKSYYEVTNSLNKKVKIPLPLFSYYKEEKDSKVTFTTLRSVKKIEPVLNDYVENLPSCYDEGYFYDKDLDITISRYYIEDNGLFNKIHLDYISGNKCKNEFVLDDNWIDDIKNNATINEINIDKCIKEEDNLKCDSKKISDINTILNYISSKEVVRIKNEKNIPEDVTTDHYLISAFYGLDNEIYTLIAFNYNDNLAFKVIDANDHSKNAIYDIDEDVNELLKNIYDNGDI